MTAKSTLNTCINVTASVAIATKILLLLLTQGIQMLPDLELVQTNHSPSHIHRLKRSQWPQG